MYRAPRASGLIRVVASGYSSRGILGQREKRVTAHPSERLDVEPL